jgi:uncharacterized protein YidB (DUF937 family)
MDILNGMSNGPRGQPAPTSQGRGMSPMTMGLLALLAYKAYQSGALGSILGQNSPRPAGPTGPATSPAGNVGGLGDWLRNALGGAATTGGAATSGNAGPVINGGLGELVKRFQQNGYGKVADSWVKTGPNAAISPHDLAKAAGAEDLDALARELGVPREQLAAQLSKDLPEDVDHLTPEGRIQEHDEDGDNEEDDEKEDEDERDEKEEDVNDKRVDRSR